MISLSAIADSCYYWGVFLQWKGSSCINGFPNGCASPITHKQTAPTHKHGAHTAPLCAMGAKCLYCESEFNTVCVSAFCFYIDWHTNLICCLNTSKWVWSSGWSSVASISKKQYPYCNAAKLVEHSHWFSIGLNNFNQSHFLIKSMVKVNSKKSKSKVKFFIEHFYTI